MSNQRGFGFIHIVLVLVIVIAGASAWKYQKRQAIEQRKLEAKQQDLEREKEKKRLDEINAEVSSEHQRAADIQKRIFAQANISIPDTNQSDMTSKTLPYLAWEAVQIDMSKPEINAFATKAKSLITSSLKDPDSAKFSDMRVFRALHTDGGFTFICGKVNAKNSFGGYTGNENYLVYKKENGDIFGGVGDSGFLSTIRSEGKWWKYDADDMCLIYGTPID